MFKGLKDRASDSFVGGKSLAERPNEYEETVWGAIYFFSLLGVVLSVFFFKGYLETTTIVFLLAVSVFTHSMKEQSRIRMLEIGIEKLRGEIDKDVSTVN